MSNQLKRLNYSICFMSNIRNDEYDNDEYCIAKICRRIYFNFY